MKKLIVVVLSSVFSMGALANSFVCQQYTDNVVDMTANHPADVYKTDNPIQSEENRVSVTAGGLTVEKSKAFNKELTFTKAEYDLVNNFAQNDRGMIFKKRDGNGQPFFMIFTTSKDETPGQKVQDNPIDRVVTLGHCKAS